MSKEKCKMYIVQGRKEKSGNGMEINCAFREINSLKKSLILHRVKRVVTSGHDLPRKTSNLWKVIKEKLRPSVVVHTSTPETEAVWVWD